MFKHRYRVVHDYKVNGVFIVGDFYMNMMLSDEVKNLNTHIKNWRRE